MPKLTSFSGETNYPPEGKEWIVVRDGYKPIPNQTRYIAISGAQSVNIGYNRSGNGLMVTDSGRSISSTWVNTVLEVIHIELPINEGTIKFSVRPGINGGYFVESGLVTIRQVATGIEIEIKGVGKAWTRNVWRDSDVAKKIREFIHTDCDDPFNEEALVWLVGVLSLPIISSYGL